MFQALKCIWNNNGVYPDLKPANVMIRCLSPSGQVNCVDDYKSAEFDNLIVKLIDLDSICFFSGSRPRRADMIPAYTGGEYASYKPPYAWPPSNLDWECNEVTNIWNMAIFALLVLCPTKRPTINTLSPYGLAKKTCVKNTSTPNLIYCSKMPEPLSRVPKRHLNWT